jgi:hypothetical protein
MNLHKYFRTLRFFIAAPLLVCSASCAYSQPVPDVTTVTFQAHVPAIKTQLVSTPVSSARAWSTAIAPNERGGWNFITQVYENKSNTATEYVVLDLQTGKYTVTEGAPGQYTNSNYQWNGQVRAANGRIFFSELNNGIAYYEPKDEAIKSLGQVIDPKDGDKIIFRLEFGPDGKLYGSTQSNGLPAVVQIDPETLEHKVLGHVGKNRKNYSYGYYVAADPTPSPDAPQGWVYVTVGQEPWELSALNIATGESKVLATREDAGWMSFDLKPEGIVAKLITGLGRADAKSEPFWVVDGKLIPYEATANAADLPFKPRDVRPHDGQLKSTPELDITQANADAEGVGRVFWRPAGSQDENAWKEASFKVKHTSPIELESLIALPDGTILGNARQYHGFFRYNPKEKDKPNTGTYFYGAHGPSGGPRALMDGKVYITGYPHSVLYVYDPAKPWTSNRRQEEQADKDLLSPEQLAALNPRKLGQFASVTQTHYAYFLLPSKNGRLYFGGRIERTGVGGGVGWYNPKTKVFGGHHENLSFLKPRGMVVLDELQRIVYSGELQDDAAKPNEKPSEAQLVVYDMDLKEVERLSIKPGLQNTGQLFPAKDKHQIIGLIPAQHIVYRYDLANKKLLNWIELPAAFQDAVQRASDGSIWTTSGDILLHVDAQTLAVKTVGKLPFVPQTMLWQGTDLYLINGGELHKTMLPPL